MLLALLLVAELPRRASGSRQPAAMMEAIGKCRIAALNNSRIATGSSGSQQCCGALAIRRLHSPRNNRYVLMRNQRESAVVPYPLGVGQQGFTLLELMIVVAIVGILSTLGMPAYKNYTIRARLSEAIIFADACKRSVYLAYTDTGQLPGTLAASGCFISDPSQPTVTTVKTPNVVSGLDVTAGGVIKVSIYGTRTGLGGACDLYLTPTPNTNATQWTGSSTCPPQYLPASFR